MSVSRDLYSISISGNTQKSFDSPSITAEGMSIVSVSLVINKRVMTHLVSVSRGDLYSISISGNQQKSSDSTSITEQRGSL